MIDARIFISNLTIVATVVQGEQDIAAEDAERMDWDGAGL